MFHSSTANHGPAEGPTILKFPSIASERDAAGLNPLLRPGAFMLGVLVFALVYYNIPGVIGGAGEEVGGWIIAIGSLTAYYLGYKVLQSFSCNKGEKAAMRRTIVGFGAAFCLAAVFIPPFFSTDVYCYGNIGWQQAKYGCNPYVYSLSEVPNWKADPLFFPSWEHAPSAYGFVFSELTCGIAWLADGNRAVATLLFKLVNVAVFACTAWLVWRGCKRFERSEPELALYLFLWNPLLLLHFIADAHNDLMTGLCSAAGILCAVASGWIIALPLLFCGTMVKYVSVILLPFLTLYLYRRFGKTKATIGLIAGTVLCMAAAAPYLAQDWRLLALDRIAGTLSEWRNYTLAAFLFYPYDVASHAFPSLDAYRSLVMSAIKLVLWSVFLAFYLRLLWIRLRGPYDAAKLLYDGVLVPFVLICFVSTKFYPWYLGMILPLAYWLPPGDLLRRAVLAVGCAQVLQFTFLREAHGINTAILLLAPLAYACYMRPGKEILEEREPEEVPIPVRRAA